MRLFFKFPGIPVPKGRPRLIAPGVVYTPAKTKSYEKLIGTLAHVGMGAKKPLEGPLYVELTAFLPQPKHAKCSLPVGKPDIDNLLKSALDGLNRIVWRDDSQICQLSLQKQYAANPRLEIKVEEITCI